MINFFKIFKRRKKILVIVPHTLKDLVEKKEYQPRYYNPNNLFEEVHLITTTNDFEIKASELKHTVGAAKLFIYNLPENLEIATTQTQDWKNLLESWAKPGIDLAKKINPCLVRLHGADWNGFLASEIKKHLGIPYVVSLHINPDINPVRRHKEENSEAQKIWNERFNYVENVGLKSADLVLPVYESIIPYLKRQNIDKYEVCYNVLDGASLKEKTNFSFGEVFKIITVGRLIPEKNPLPIINAVAKLPNTELTIVGNGELLKELQSHVTKLSLNDRIIFKPAVENRKLCESLSEFDLFAIYTDYWELNKSLLEALLTGLPIVINKRLPSPAPELINADFVKMVSGDENSYLEAIKSLMKSKAVREKLGRKAYDTANKRWSPVVAEDKFASIYKRFLRQRENIKV